ISLWQRHPWSHKQPDLQWAFINYTKDAKTEELFQELLQCRQMLGFITPRKLLYLKFTHKDSNGVVQTTPRPQMCLDLGNFDFKDALEGIFKYQDKDPRLEKCRKNKPSILGEHGCGG
ncbi:hypothetical protein PENTCL1PPCAC_7272, partial [Pristionchus entomophagus]